MSRMLFARVRWEPAFRNFGRRFCSQTSAETLETSLVAFDQIKNYVKCKDLFHEAIEKGTDMTEKTVTLGLIGCLMADGDTTWVHQTSATLVAKGYREAFVPLLYTYYLNEDRPKVRGIISDPPHFIDIDLPFWTNMFELCNVMKDTVSAVELFDDMVKLGVSPPQICVTRLFETWSSEVPLMKTQELYYRVKTTKTFPLSQSSYNALASVLIKDQDLDFMSELVHDAIQDDAMNPHTTPNILDLTDLPDNLAFIVIVNRLDDARRVPKLRQHLVEGGIRILMRENQNQQVVDILTKSEIPFEVAEGAVDVSSNDIRIWIKNNRLERPEEDNSTVLERLKASIAGLRMRSKYDMTVDRRRQKPDFSYDNI